MRVKFSKWIFYIFPIVLVLIILFLTKNQWQEFAKLKRINVLDILLISILFIAFQFTQGFILNTLLKTVSINLSLKEVFILINMRSFLNYIPMNAGLIGVGLYMRKSYSLPLSIFAGLSAGRLLLSFLTYGILGMFSIFYLLLTKATIPVTVAISIFFLLAFPVLLIIIPLPKMNSSNRIVSFLINIKKGWEILRVDFKSILFVISFHVLLVFIMSIRFWIICDAINLKLPLIVILLIVIFSNILRVNTLFPGNLGIREAVAGLIAKEFSIDFIQGFIPTSVDHIIAFFWIVFLGIFSTIHLSHIIKK